MTTLLYKPIADLTSLEHERIREIVQPYYQDATLLLKRAISHNNYIYLSYVDGVLAAFFMVAWEPLLINGVQRPSLFLGLVCVDPAFRNKKLVSAMYKKSALDVADWQAEHNDELILWFTTATPVVWHMMAKIYQIIPPTSDAAYSQELIAIARAIQQHHYPHARFYNHPFILKGVATATVYSPSERSYLQNENSTMFEQLGVDERAGDRLLVLCTLPEKDALE